MTQASATTLDSIKRSLVGLRMPRALEVLDATIRRMEQGEIDGIGAKKRAELIERGAQAARSFLSRRGDGDSR